MPCLFEDILEERIIRFDLPDPCGLFYQCAGKAGQTVVRGLISFPVGELSVEATSACPLTYVTLRVPEGARKMELPPGSGLPGRCHERIVVGLPDRHRTIPEIRIPTEQGIQVRTRARATVADGNDGNIRSNTEREVEGIVEGDRVIRQAHDRFLPARILYRESRRTSCWAPASSGTLASAFATVDGKPDRNVLHGFSPLLRRLTISFIGTAQLHHRRLEVTRIDEDIRRRVRLQGEQTFTLESAGAEAISAMRRWKSDNR